MFKHILLATDGSPASDQAAVLAVDLARALAARLTAVFVVDPYPYLGIGEANPLGLQAYLATAREHAAKAHAQVVQLCDQQGLSSQLELRLAEDVGTVPGILNIARDEQADVIVVGSHGRSGAHRLLLGSIASRVASLSPVPVLIAR